MVKVMDPTGLSVMRWFSAHVFSLMYRASFLEKRILTVMGSPCVRSKAAPQIFSPDQTHPLNDLLKDVPGRNYFLNEPEIACQSNVVSFDLQFFYKLKNHF